MFFLVHIEISANVADHNGVIVSLLIIHGAPATSYIRTNVDNHDMYVFGETMVDTNNPFFFSYESKIVNYK